MKNIKEMDVYSEEFLYNKKLDTIWDNHNKHQRETVEFYAKALKHLQDTGQGFCFTERGVVSIEDATRLSNPF